MEQSVGIGTAVFTGYALHLGADASYISLFTAVAYLLATVQLLMPVLGRYLRRKRTIISVGMVEIALRSSPPLVPLLFAPRMQLEALMVLVGLVQHLGGRRRAREHTGPVHQSPDHREHPRGHARRNRYRPVHRRLRGGRQTDRFRHRLLRGRESSAASGMPG